MHTGHAGVCTRITIGSMIFLLAVSVATAEASTAVRPLSPVLRRTGSALESQQGTVCNEQAVKYRSGRAQPLMISSERDERQDVQRTPEGKRSIRWTFTGSLADCRAIRVEQA